MASTTHGQSLVLPQNIRYLALGDSYTIGQNVNSHERWPSQLGDSLTQRNYQLDTLEYIATTGWTTQNLLNGITNQNLVNKNFNLVSVLIGVNNQYQGQPFNLFLTQFPQLLDSAIAYAGGDTASVFVLSIPDYAYTPFGQSTNPSQISMEIDQYNAAKDSICEAYGIKYFNITPISREGLAEPGLVASDGLHPSREQYTLWVEEILSCIDANGSVGLNSDTLPNTSIYPNPTRSKIFIEDFQKYDSFAIYASNGKLLRNKLLQSDVIDVGNLENGTYILQLKATGKCAQSRRFILDK